MITLGIETSCDETALALIETRGHGATLECRVIASLVHSQAELHSAYGGVFPTLAKREHGRNIVPLLKKLLDEAGLERRTEKGERRKEESQKADEMDATLRSPFSILRSPKTEPFLKDLQTQNPDLYESLSHADFLEHAPAIDRIAVTEGPGLEPALWVGIVFARILGTYWNIPVIPVNHMEGHVVGSLLPSDSPRQSWQKLHELPLPAIALLISGGHTELVKIEATKHPGAFEYAIIGRTKDDAVGEAFDKAARLLGLPYPGGPHMAKLAHEAWQEGIEPPVKLPRPMISSGDLDFSFSGLKTAVLYAVRDAKEVTEAFKKGLAYEFEQAVTETLSSKLRAGIDATGAQSVILGGGVSANHVLRKHFKQIAEEYGIPLFLPTQHISGDNALMIALAAAMNGDKTNSRELKAHGTKHLGDA